MTAVSWGLIILVLGVTLWWSAWLFLAYESGIERKRYELVKLTRQMMTNRRVAIQRGELKRMYPGAIWDIITLWWFRGVMNR